MASRTSAFISESWYHGAVWLYLLFPFSLLYRVVIWLRKYLYRLGILSTYRASIPVVVVGNITVGGTGKSPLVAYIVESLKQMGYQPGIVSRGYGAAIQKNEVREVLSSSTVSEVGDEPLMLKLRAACPIMVSPSRYLAVQALEAKGCDIVIADDGLQHYALQRDIEICVFDGERKWGNGRLLPMGPMREPLARVSSTDFIVVNGGDWTGLERPQNAVFRMELSPGKLKSLNEKMDMDLADFSGRKVNAIAGIGNPQRFFSALAAEGLQLESHSFSDHHAYTEPELNFNNGLPLLMTEKDAVKCMGFKLTEAWYLPVSAKLNGNLAAELVASLKLKGWLNG